MNKPQVRWYLGQLTHPKTWNFDVKHSTAIIRQFRVEKIPSSRDSQGSHDLPALATALPTHHVVVPVAERRLNVTSSGPGVCLGVQFQWTKWLCNHSRGPTTSGGQYHSHCSSEPLACTPNCEAVGANAWTTAFQAHLCPCHLGFPCRHCWTNHSPKILVNGYPWFYPCHFP